MTKPSDAGLLDLAAVLEWTKELGAEAAARALALKAEGLSVREKPDGSLVTDVDRGVERFLRDAIAARYPGHAIYGEEFGGAGQTSQAAPLWALDPIDGTTNLAHGLPHWGVSIGLIVAGVPAVGVAVFPELRETFAGAKGLGATRNGAPMAAVGGGGPLALEDVYGFCTESARRCRFKGAVHPRIRIFGSSALDACWTAAGLLGGTQTIGVSLYDVAAGICVGREVGVEAGWLASGAPFSADDHALTGARHDDALVIAPPATLRYVRSVLDIGPLAA